MNKEWLKKNWMWIALAVLVIAVIIGIIRYKKKEKEIVIKLPKMPKMPGMAGRGVAPAGESAEQAKAKLDECMKGTANIRLATGAPHPCAALQDAFDKAKAAESSFVGPFTEQNGLNLQDFAMGADGTSLLMDKQLKK